MGETIVGKLALELGVNTEEFKKQLFSLGKTTKSQTASMAGMFGKLGTIIATTFAVSAIVNFSKECLELGSDLAEVQNVVNVTYGDMAEQVNSFAKEAMTSYGLSEKVAKQYMGTFGAMSKSFGYTTEAAYEQAAALTGLAGDVASFYNLTTDEAYTKLKSVFTGETESLKELGVVMTQTALDEYALQQGMGKTTSQMSEQEKVALRLAFVTDRLSAASGDFINTSKGWANQTRVLSLRFDALKATLGQGLINVLTPLLGLINELLAKLQSLADAFYDITVKMFGEADTSSGGVLSTAAGSVGEMAEGMANTEGSAKSLKKILAGFDKLNVLGSSFSGSDGGGTSGNSGTGSTSLFGAPAGGSLPGYDTSEMQNKLVEITELVGVFKLALGAVFTFTGVNIPLGISLMALGAAEITAAVAMNENAIITPIATGLDLLTTILSGALLVVGAILCFSGVNIPLGIALLSIGAVGLVSSAAMNWGVMTNEISTLITGITAGVSAAALALGIILLWAGVSIPLGIALVAVGAVGLVTAVAPNWNAMTGSVNSTVTTISAIVGGALLGLGAVLAFSGLFVGLGIALMGAGAVTLAAAVAPNWSGLSEETKSTIYKISAIAGGAMLALGVILLCCGIVPLGLGLMAAGAASLATAIAPNWNGIVKAVKDVFTKIGDIANSCFKGIGNFFIGLLNGLIDGLNFMIGAINKIPGVDLPKVKKVPMLANGGYVAANTPQLAVIGDNKREGEIVAPESKIAEAVAAGFAAVMSKMRQSSGNKDERPIYLTLKLGEGTFWEGFVDYHNSIVKRTGDSPLLV
jgi:hypothetical protein